MRLGLIDTASAKTFVPPEAWDFYALQSAVGRVGERRRRGWAGRLPHKPCRGWMTGQVLELDGGARL